MIGFKRGVSIMDALGLGEFSIIGPRLEKYMDDLLAGKLQSNTWHSYNTGNYGKYGYDVYEVEPKLISYKNKLDKGGGNNHRFYTRMTLNDFRNYDSIKAMCRQYENQMEGYVGDGFKRINTNFYIGKKYFEKAGIEYKPNSILIEIVYSKKEKS